MKAPNQEINRQAAVWAAKLDSGDISPEEQEKLEAWLAADLRHLGAFGRSLAVLERLDRIRAAGTSAVRPFIPEDRPIWTRRRVVVASGAAGLAAAGVAGVVFLKDGPPADLPSSVEKFATQIGETRTVTLADGSVLTLNTNSKLVVGFTANLRKVRLVRGETLFNVAKDKARPFIVTADDTQIRAVGTSFTVRLLQQRPVQIVVQEGIVEVTRRSMPHAAPVRAVADTQTVVQHGAPIATQAVTYTKVARTLAWQYGQIAFDNETLDDASREFARYSNTRIVVDPAIANRTITGLFSSNDPVGFARAAAAVLNLRTEIGTEEVRISR